MPKLYISQKVFSFADRFRVKNEYEEELFRVEGEVLSLGKKLHVFDSTEREVIFIQQKLWSFKPRFFVSVDGVQIAEIVREWSFRPRYTIAGMPWTVEGDLWGHDYRILEEGREVVGIRKAWLSWGDCYEVEIARSEDTLPALAVVLAIDAVLAQEQAAAHSSSGN